MTVIDKRATSIERAVRVPGSAEAVFGHLTDAATVATMFGAVRAVVEPRKDGAFEVYFRLASDTDSTRGCKIIEFERATTLVVQFRGPTEHRPFDFMTDTTIAFSMASDGQDATVTIRHDGFCEGQEWDEAREYFEARWDEWVHNLEMLVAVSAQANSAGTDSAVPTLPRYDLASVRLSSIPDVYGLVYSVNVADQV